MKFKRYCVLNAGADQSRAIIKFLRRYKPEAVILGAQIADDAIVYELDGRQHRLAIAAADAASQMCLVPTGADSTARVLASLDNITLGDITLDKAALKVSDKLWMLELAASVGVPVPATWRSVADIASFPVFYKCSYERGGGPRGIARTAAELPDMPSYPLIFQEVIGGEGTYGVAFLAKAGEMLVAFTHFERESWPKEGGSAVIVERFFDPRLLAYTERLLRSLHYSGWGLAEFKYCPERKNYVFMEINAKFWASCEFAFVNEPRFLSLLFDIRSKERGVDRMIFMKRAFARGSRFVFSVLPHHLLGSSLCFEPGWWRQAAKSLLPFAIGRKSASNRSPSPAGD